MAVTILAVTVGVKLLHLGMGGAVDRLTQGWRQR